MKRYKYMNILSLVTCFAVCQLHKLIPRVKELEVITLVGETDTIKPYLNLYSSPSSCCWVRQCGPVAVGSTHLFVESCRVLSFPPPSLRQSPIGRHDTWYLAEILPRLFSCFWLLALYASFREIEIKSTIDRATRCSTLDRLALMIDTRECCRCLSMGLNCLKCHT